MSPSPDETIRLTPLQMGMVYHHLREGRHSGVDVVQVVVGLDEAIDVAGLKQAWQEVVAAEPALRLSVHLDGSDSPTGLVSTVSDVPFREVDLAGVDPAGRESAFRQALHEDEVRGFDLSDGPLLRLTLFRLDPERFRLVWTLHHLIADGRSYALVLDDVFRIYDGLDRPEGRPSFRTWLDWTEQRSGDADRAFWEGLLSGVRPPAPLPGERAIDAPDRGAPGPRTYLQGRIDAKRTDRLRAIARERGGTLSTLIQAAWAITLSRFGQGSDVTFGVIQGGRSGTVPDADRMVGLFIRTLPFRVPLDRHDALGPLLRDLRSEWIAMREAQHASIADIQAWSGVTPGTLLFRSVLNVQDPFWGEPLVERDGPWRNRTVELHNRLVYPLTVAANAGRDLGIRFEFDPSEVDEGVMEHMLDSLLVVLDSFATAPDRPIGEVPVLSHSLHRTLVSEWSRIDEGPAPEGTVHEQFEAMAARRPDADAVVFGERGWSYGELDRRSARVARAISKEGLGPGDRVGIVMERGLEMVGALLGVLKAGAAFVPIDPNYPAERIRMIAEDAGVGLLLTDSRDRLGLRDPAAALIPGVPVLAVDESLPDGPLTGDGPKPVVDASELAYVIYTSGSTGRPKGVMVEHRNVTAFFDGMDEVLGDPAGESWLALTSISFDISILELLWTLTRGARVVIYPDQERTGEGHGASAADHRISGRRSGSRMDFSLFYFSAEGDEGESPPEPGRSRYRLLLEGSRIADQGGLVAVWTPERHFHEFGGIYPNPSVTGAALAAVTERIRIRAGSVVLPLHDPIRVAEEWAVVDNLSDGRVDLSFASGWHDRDFVFAPDDYEDRREGMFREIETLRALWRGDSITRRAPKGEVEVRIHPRPVQRELPVWVTAGGSPETFRRAGEVGASLLTHLLGQSPDELEEKIGVYRSAWRAAGHPGEGHVSLMLHTYIGTSAEEVRAKVRAPFRNYLRTSVGLISALAEGQGSDLRSARLDDDEMEALLDHAFERYHETSALMGTMESCLEMVNEMARRGVDEIACLTDFGVDENATLEGIRRIPELMRQANEAAPTRPLPETVGEAIRRHGVRHLQCTPSTVRLILAEDDHGLDRLDTLLVGGEAFPGDLARRVRRAVGPDTRIVNMYGPTETTIWSATFPVRDGSDSTVPIGTAIRGTGLHVVPEDGPLDRLVPPGVAGELLIGGRGVARGYLARPELTADRFITSTIPGVQGRLYRTGDLVRRRSDGVLEFLGRLDQQVKIRGHRIEPGEIEAVLATHPAVAEAVVTVRRATPPANASTSGEPSGVEGEGDRPPTEDRLICHLVAPDGAPTDAELRRFLLDRLPPVMVPSHFVRLDALPLTPNAKIDRARLPEPRTVRPSSDAEPARVFASGGLESLIASTWMQVLEVPSVGLDDNFFDLGGHSLLTIRVQASLSQELDRRISITDLFRFPTVRALAAHLGGSGDDEPGLAEVQDRAAARRNALRRRHARGRA